MFKKNFSTIKRVRTNRTHPTCSMYTTPVKQIKKIYIN
jgi:hypothetical protein